MYNLFNYVSRLKIKTAALTKMYIFISFSLRIISMNFDKLNDKIVILVIV